MKLTGSPLAATLLLTVGLTLGPDTGFSGPEAARAEEKPRLIVLPLQPEEGQTYEGTGLAVHFLLGNLVALHTGFREFWFGWRVRKIFPDPERLTAYCRNSTFPLDIPALTREQGIRYWLKGLYRNEGSHIRVTLELVDADQGGEKESAVLTLTPGNRVIDFCEDFLSWLDEYGYPLSDTQKARILWPEEIHGEGLDLLGRAIAYYYGHVSYQAAEPLDLRPFDRAAAAAPASYLTHDFRAWGLYRTKDYAAAQKAFQSALEVNPNGVGAVSGMMWCAIYTGRKADAVHWAERKAALRGESLDKARGFVEAKMEKLSGEAQGSGRK